MMKNKAWNTQKRNLQNIFKKDKFFKVSWKETLTQMKDKNL